MKSFYSDKAVKNHLCTSGIIVRNGKVLLGFRHYKEISVWIAPGGRCETGEKPEDAVLREVSEEIGVSDAQIVRKLGEKDGAYEDETGKDKVMVYEIETKQEPRLMEPEKFSEWRWFGLDELPEKLIGQQNKDFFRKAIENLP